MKSFKITYRVKFKEWETRYLIVRAYTSEGARAKFDMWEGLITDIYEI